MSYDSTESVDVQSSIGSGGSVFLPHTDVNDARCEAYDLPLTKTARNAIQRRDAVRKSDKPSRQFAAVTDQARRYSLGLHLRRARSQTKELTLAIGASDEFAAADAGIALSKELSDLWILRDLREAEWAAALNFLQSALAREEFERFQIEKCEAVRKVVEDVLAAGLVDDEDVGRVRRTLREAGLDPWKAISQQDE